MEKISALEEGYIERIEQDAREEYIDKRFGPGNPNDSFYEEYALREIRAAQNKAVQEEQRRKD